MKSTISKQKRKNLILMLAFVPLIPAFILLKKTGAFEALLLIFTCWSIALLCLISRLFSTLTYEYGKTVLKTIGEILSKVALFITYVVAVIPTGIIMKLVKRDRLRLKKINTKSYWKDVESTEQSYENQF